ncbi:MAG: secretin N-terminal domain-containing protein, partial [Candidatus Babeliales bacterium]
MNSILKVLSTFLFGISTACFGQLLIPDMPLSSGQVAATGTMPQNQPSVQPFVTPVVQSQPTPIVVTPALPPIMPTQMPTVAVPTTMPVTTITPPAQPFIPQVIPQAPPQPALPPVQPQNLFPQTAPIVPNLLAPPITPSSQLQFVVPDEEDKDKKNIYLNFENSDLSSFVNYMAELKNLNLIPDQTLEAAKISLTIREPLSVDGAWNVFLTVLDTAGFAIVQTGDIWKVLPKDKKLNQPLPAYINVAADKLPDNDITIRYVFFLTNIQVGDIKTLLESMLSSPNVLVDQPQLNAFIITDKSLNIKAAVKLIQELDQEGLPEEVTVLPLKRANAVDVKALLDSLIVKPDVNPIARLLGKVTEGTASYFSPTTRIIPEERTNSLILLGNKKSNQKIIDFITNQIDTELKDTESPLHIYELQYADATAVMDILKEVTAAPESVNGSQASKFGSIRGGVKYFKEMKFKVDKDGNRLIVSSTDKQDWKLLEKTIADLDKPQPQIVIESLIVLVDVKDTMELGGSIRSKKHGALGINTDFQASMLNSPSLEMDSSSNPVSLMGNLLTQLTANQGAALLSFGKQASVWAVLKILKQLTNTSILSQPSITVANKTQATIEIGTQARVVQATVNAGGGATNTGYQTVSATTKLNITPQINADGLVRLDVNLNIDQFLDTTYLSNTTKEVKTNVTVADGQVLVLGGFVKTSTQETTYKVPILGDIPILGWFFKSQRRELHKEYTFVFMAPTIIKPRQAPGSGLYTKMKFHQATDDIENAIETKRVKDPIHNWFFNPQKENYSHKVIDFANARYQPTTVDIKNDPYYRSNETIKDYKPDQAIVQNREKITPEPEATQEPAQVFPNVEQPAEPIATPTEPQPIQLPIIPEPVQPPAPLVTQPPVLQPRLQPLPQTPAIPAQQPRPQLIKRPKLPPTIPEEQKELAALEQEIMQRRQALKANMAAPAQKS